MGFGIRTKLSFGKEHKSVNSTIKQNMLIKEFIWRVSKDGHLI